MKRRPRAALGLLLAALALGASAPAALASPGFGLKGLAQEFSSEDGSAATQAGSHPFAAVNAIEVNTVGAGKGELPIDAVKDLRVTLPPGFTGNPLAVPRCSGADFIDITEGIRPACPNSTAVGTALVATGIESPDAEYYAVYNLSPPPGVAARLGFIAIAGVPFSFDLGVKPTPPYNLLALPSDIPQPIRFYGATLDVWGNPAAAVHDPLRGRCLAGDGTTLGNCPSGVPNRPFLVMPRSCTGPLLTSFEADSWQQPGTWIGPYEIQSPAMSGCEKLAFGPRISARPTSQGAESPSGLDFGLDVQDEGIDSPEGLADSDLKKAVVTLPEGVTINPSQAEGLGVCSEAQLAGETAFSGPGEGCPQASKVGTVEVETPILEGEILKGALFVAAPYTNRFGSLIALYMTLKDPKLGIGISMAGKVEPDPRSGQLVSTFDDIPQQPFSHFRLHFREGGRSPLVTPPLCGPYTTTAKLYPWANPGVPYETTSSFTIDRGPNGQGCPAAGTPPFAPGYQAGTLDNAAGQYAPYYLQLARRDGDQDMTRFSTTLPAGVVGKIAGVSRCPQGAVEAAKARSGPHAGAEELASPSCPASSLIGRTLSAAGVGSELTYVPGSLYLGGPYHGDPLSAIAITPALAGPFDAGVVVVQEALDLNPLSAEVEVDGTASDPIPHILKGIPLKVREIRVLTDRPAFTLNPTSCEAERTQARLWGGGADVFSSADDVALDLAVPFQAANCARLAFKPKLAISLKGGTRRGAHPALKAIATPRPGDANFASAVVTLPHSAFLEQSHIRTVCTRVQFAAAGGNGAGCPAGSVYGWAKAWSPLLDEPLQGPVYLRSSSHNLPDLVVALHGIVDIDLSARIDSIHGGIRSHFEGVPDAPVSRFVLQMQGAKKGLIVNSTDICGQKHRFRANLGAQNGRRSKQSPVLRARCAGG